MNRFRCAVVASIAGILLLGGCGSSAPPFNATPAITNLFPSNITAGSQDFTLFVVGTGFISSAKGTSFVYWNGFPRSTTMNQTTGQLEVQIFASDVASPGTVNVTVVNPAPGGGISLPSGFTIEPVQPGAPVIAVNNPFSPPSAKAGGAAFTLTVNGANFAANDPVTWNGDVRTTTFVNSSQLTATINATDIANAGSGSVAVYTPGLVVGSPSVNFPITGPDNPVPSTSTLAPSSAAVGSGDTEVLISGSGFTAMSTAEWVVGMSTTPLATAFLSSSQVIALVPAADLTAAASAMIDVTTPAPGGGTSKQLPFTVK